jgi:hypothetical protein
MESNSVAQLNQNSFQNWCPGQNEVLVELDPSPPRNLDGAKDVYVGGPAVLVSAAIQVFYSSIIYEVKLKYISLGKVRR